MKTRYEWIQEQRRTETAIRRQKDVANLAKASGDDVLRREAQSHINTLQEHYARISAGAGLTQQPERAAVAGFRRVKTIEEFSDDRKYRNASFETPKSLEKHVRKHIAEYGDISEEEYINRAQKLLRQSPSDDILVLKRADGSVAKYRISTNEFVVGTKEGAIRTAFKPQNGYDYWRTEIERNQ